MIFSDDTSFPNTISCLILLLSITKFSERSYYIYIYNIFKFLALSKILVRTSDVWCHHMNNYNIVFLHTYSLYAHCPQVRAARSQVQDTVDGNRRFPWLPVVNDEQLRGLPGRRHRVSGSQHENRTAADPRRIPRRSVFEYGADAMWPRPGGRDDRDDQTEQDRNKRKKWHCCRQRETRRRGDNSCGAGTVDTRLGGRRLRLI